MNLRAFLVGVLSFCLCALIPATRTSAAGDQLKAVLFGIIQTDVAKTADLQGNRKVTFTIENFGRDFKGQESAKIEITIPGSPKLTRDKPIGALHQFQKETLTFDVPASLVDDITIRVIEVHPCPNSGHPPCTNH